MGRGRSEVATVLIETLKGECGVSWVCRQDSPLEVPIELDVGRFRVGTRGVRDSRREDRGNYAWVFEESETIYIDLLIVVVVLIAGWNVSRGQKVY
jgi:hypothetical protein